MKNDYETDQVWNVSVLMDTSMGNQFWELRGHSVNRDLLEFLYEKLEKQKLQDEIERIRIHSN